MNLFLSPKNAFPFVPDPINHTVMVRREISHFLVSVPCVAST